jgi:hypothetical protein
MSQDAAPTITPTMPVPTEVAMPPKTEPTAQATDVTVVATVESPTVRLKTTTIAISNAFAAAK